MFLALVFFFNKHVLAQGTTSVCAKVKMQINQQLTLERQAFIASMGINNGNPVSSLDNIQVTVNFTDKDGNGVTATSDPTNTTAKFFIRLNDGSSIPTSVAAGASANISWLIIPAQSTGGQFPSGVLYNVGATITYSTGGIPQTVNVTPDYIFVMPLPNLVLDYFLPNQVYSRDPFSTTIDPPVPFSLGVRVKNTGFGTAQQLSIDTAQPRIVDNQQGLAVNFQIIGSEVNGATATPNLLVNFGDIAPNASGIARWIMTSSLSGKFVSFNASFTHSDLLGGQLTSLIASDAIHTHLIIHDVLVDLPGRDAIRDFLAKDSDTLRVYESQNTDTVVADLSSSASITPGSNGSYTLTLPTTPGFGYAQVPDPTNGTLVVTGATRADGKTMNPANVWSSKTFDTTALKWNYYLNVFDVNNTPGYFYTINMGAAVVSNPPILAFIPDQIVQPQNTLNFAVSATTSNGTPVSLSSGILPAGATFTSTQGNGTFTWTPSTGQLGTYPVQFTATGSNGQSASQTVRITVTNLSRLDAWKALKWPGVTDPTIIGNLANPSGDGISNLVKYALNLDPTEPSLTGLPIVGMDTINGKRYLTLTYMGRTDDPSLTFTVIASNSAKAPDSSWTPQTTAGTVDQVGVPSGMQRVKIVDSVAVENGPPRRFIKLQVTTP